LNRVEKIVSLNEDEREKVINFNHVNV